MRGDGMSAVSLKSDLNVYIGNEIIPGLISVNTEEIVSEDYAREILSAEAWDIVSTAVNYNITLKFFGEKPLIYGKGFTLTVERNNARTVYKNCLVKSVSDSYENGKLSTRIQIISSEKE
jgi:hypothetical protein